MDSTTLIVITALASGLLVGVVQFMINRYALRKKHQSILDEAAKEAEVMKKDPAQEHAVFPVVRPVVEKMASIVKANLRVHPVDAIYVVGGACCFSQFEQVFEKNIGISTIKPAAPLLVTPLGIAMNA